MQDICIKPYNFWVMIQQDLKKFLLFKLMLKREASQAWAQVPSTMNYNRWLSVMWGEHEMSIGMAHKTPIEIVSVAVIIVIDLPLRCCRRWLF